MLIIYILLTYLCTQISVAQDPCQDAIPITYMTERLVGYQLKDPNSAICDYYLKSPWYSMDHYVIANTTESCGTLYNWYTVGTLPKTPNVVTEMSVCKHSPRKNCTATDKISAVLCDDGNYVFHLPPRTGCSEGFCIRSLTNEKVASAPDISSMTRPTIHADIADENTLVFYCEFIAPSEHYLYDIDWSLSTGLSLARRIKTFKAVEYKGKARFRAATQLTEAHLKKRGIITLGFTLVCSVKAKSEKAGRYSSSVISDSKFCGVELKDNGWLTVHKDETKTAQLRLTVPFGQDFDVQTLDFVLYLPTVTESNEGKCKISQAAIIRDRIEDTTCAVKFSKEDARNKNWKELKISGFVGQKPMAFNRVFIVQLISMKYSPHPLFSNYSIDPIHVQLMTDSRQIDGKKCYAHSDPHMFSFDGRAYENQNEGTFVLFRNNKYNVETQIKTDKCPNYSQNRNGPWCVCGVAVRAGRDVFKMDNCGSGGKVDPRFERCGDRVLQRKVKRKAGGKEYKVFLPSGSEVSIRMNWETFLEVDIFPSILDVDSSDGLCGNFNGDINDDPNVNTALKWIVKAKSDLFNLDDHSQMQPWTMSKYMCTCDNGVSVSPNYINEAKCDTSKVRICEHDSLIDVNNAMCSVVERRKRSTNEHLYSVDRHTSTETDFRSSIKHVDKIAKIHKRSIYTPETAKKDCIKTMNTTLFRSCSNLPTLNMEPFIENCVSDAVVSNSMDWTNVHLEGIKKQCIYNIDVNQPLPAEVTSELNKLTNDPKDFKRNATNNQTNVASTGMPQMPETNQSFIFTEELLETIQSISCLNDCSGHGKCERGNCICDTGYMDIDCSLREDQVPEMLGIPDRGICDLRKRKCRQTSVFGKYIVESPSLSCKVKSFQIEKDGYTREKESVTKAASLDSFTQLTCELPSSRSRRSLAGLNDNFIAQGYSVSISNDKHSYSEEDVIVVFDSECVNCSKQSGKVVCTLKSGYCMNNGNCYRVGDLFGCYICNGDQPDKISWIEGPDCPVPKQPPGQKLWIIGAALGPVVLLLVVLFVVFYCKMKKKPAHIRKADSVNPIYGEN